MQPDRRCPRCAQIIPWGCEECPYCSARRGYFWSVRRDTFLAVVFVLLVVLFIATGIVVGRFHGLERRLGEDWYVQGVEALKAKKASVALTDFRNALAYSRGNPVYELWLAQALAATGRVPEARLYLLNLRDHDPGNGPVTLELARLAAQEHDMPEALQFYHDAVYCEWSGDAAAQRRAVRLELIRFLLDSDQKAVAHAELTAVAANLPPEPAQQMQVARLLMEADGYDDAARLFRQVLAEDPHSAEALAGAGECYFRTAQYTLAEPYLNRALRLDPKLTQVVALRDTVRAVLELDPFARWLGEEQRAERAHRDFDQAMSRLQDCAAQRGVDLTALGNDPLQKLYARATELQATSQQRVLSRDSESVANMMDLVFDIERATSQLCGEPHGMDLALLLIAREQEGARP